MESWVIVVQFLLGTGTVLFLLWPLVSGSQEGLIRGSDYDARRSTQRSLLQALSDLEYEHETGKINDRDYRRLRNHFLRRARNHFDEPELNQLEKQIEQAEHSGDDRDLEALIDEARTRLD